MKITTYLAMACTKGQFLADQGRMRWARWYLRDPKAGPEKLWNLLSRPAVEVGAIRVVRLDQDPDGILGTPTESRLGIGIAVCARSGPGNGHALSATELERLISDDGAPDLAKSPFKHSTARYYLVVGRADS